MQNRTIFLTHGGKTFHYIPALNFEPMHIELMTEIIRQHAGDWLTLKQPRDKPAERAKAQGAKH